MNNALVLQNSSSRYISVLDIYSQVPQRGTREKREHQNFVLQELQDQCFVLQEMLGLKRATLVLLPMPTEKSKSKL